MSDNKPTPGGRAKKNAPVSLVRSSVAEYLTFVAAGCKSEASALIAFSATTNWNNLQLLSVT
jgi:hypothetical protein